MDDRLFGSEAPPLEGLSMVVLGAGGAGVASLSRMRRRLPAEARLVAYDTSQAALSRLPEGVEPRLLAPAVYGGRGSAGDALGLRAWLEETGGPEAHCREADLVVLVGAVGGGTGAAALPWLAARLADAPGVLLGHLIVPLGLESHRAMERGERALDELATRLNAWLALSNDRLEGSRAEGTPLADAWRAGDRVLLDLLARLAPASEAVLPVDAADALGFLRHGGPLHWGRGRGSGPDRLEAALDGAFADDVLRPHELPPHRALLWLRGAGVSAGEHRAAVAATAARLAPASDGTPGSVRVGVEEGPEGLEAAVLASPFSVPEPVLPEPAADIAALA